MLREGARGGAIAAPGFVGDDGWMQSPLVSIVGAVHKVRAAEKGEQSCSWRRCLARRQSSGSASPTAHVDVEPAHPLAPHNTFLKLRSGVLVEDRTTAAPAVLGSGTGIVSSTRAGTGRRRWHTVAGSRLSARTLPIRLGLTLGECRNRRFPSVVELTALGLQPPSSRTCSGCLFSGGFMLPNKEARDLSGPTSRGADWKQPRRRLPPYIPP